MAPAGTARGHDWEKRWPACNARALAAEMTLMGSSRLLALVLLAALPACVVTEERDQAMASGGNAVITRTEAVRAWIVMDGNESVGTVVMYAKAENLDDPTQQFYSVRNSLHQELGTVDGLGRAWRFVPHQRDPDWTTSGSVVQGARAILGAGSDAELVEVSLEELGSALVSRRRSE